MALMSKERLARYNSDSGSNASFIRIPFFKLGQGTTKVRVLPGQEPGSVDKDYYVLVYLHYKVSPTKPTVPVVCAKTKDPRNSCVICDYTYKLRNSDDPADKLQADDMGQRMKFAMVVMPLEGEDKGKQMVFMAPKKIWSKINSLGGDSEYGDVTHPTEGFDLKITKTGTGKKGTDYDCVPVRNPSPIVEDPEELKEILDHQFDLWRFKVIPSPEEVTAFMNGEIDRLTTDGFTLKAGEKVEDAPVQANRRPVDAPNEEEEEPKEEEEEPPPPPTRRVPPPTAEGAARKSNLDALRGKLNSVK